MSDFDRNAAAARGGYADRAVAYDAGLRAHMIRVYNYMASAVGLTGVVAYLTFQMVGGNAITVTGGKIAGLTPLGQFLFGGPFMWVLMLAPLAMVLVLSFGINAARPPAPRALLFFVYAAILGVSLATIFIVYTRASIARRVLHLGGGLRRAEPVRLHHQARSVGDRLVPDHGPDRPHHRQPGQYLPEVERARLRHLDRSAFWSLPA